MPRTVRTRVLALALAVALVAAVAIACTPDRSPVARAGAAAEPNIVLILTDDQRFDTLWAMPAVRAGLQDKGLTFRNGIISDPLCCPSRASILTGRYPGGHGVWSNFADHGAWITFHDRGNEDHTIATALSAAGYRTGLVGKYLNSYDRAEGVVPPGWDRWFAFDEGNSEYYDYSVVDATDGVGTIRRFGDRAADYSTDVLRREAVRFIRRTPADQPLFLYTSVAGPHGPVPIPARRDVGTYAGRRWPHRPSFNELDVRDKPSYIRKSERVGLLEREKLETRMQNVAETLRSVDLLVKHVIAALKDTGRLANTMIVFMSDNGYLQLEHRWHYKVVPYEESIRVPFVVRYDPLIRGTPRQGTTTQQLVSNVDLAPTWAAIGGATLSRPVDGVNFQSVLGGAVGVRRDVLLESYRYSSGAHTTVPSYCGLRTAQRVYVRYASGEQELYDLTKDPYQLKNLAKHDPPLLQPMRARTKALCSPTPPAFRWSA